MKCIPPEVQRLADQAEKRKDETIERLTRLVDREAPDGDPFVLAIERLIDADKNVVEMIRRKA